MWQKMLPVGLNEQIFENYRYGVRSPQCIFLKQCVVIPAMAGFPSHLELVKYLSVAVPNAHL